jgi:hypothetical protein
VRPARQGGPKAERQLGHLEHTRLFSTCLDTWVLAIVGGHSCLTTAVQYCMFMPCDVGIPACVCNAPSLPHQTQQTHPQAHIPKQGHPQPAKGCCAYACVPQHQDTHVDCRLRSGLCSGALFLHRNMWLTRAGGAAVGSAQAIAAARAWWSSTKRVALATHPSNRWLSSPPQHDREQNEASTTHDECSCPPRRLKPADLEPVDAARVTP